MIHNEREYAITKIWIAKFETAIRDFQKETHDQVHPLFVKAYLESLKGQLNDLDTQILEYEREKRSQTLFDLQKLLIEGKEFKFKARDINYVFKREVRSGESLYIIQLENSSIDAVSWLEFEKAIMHIFALIGDMH